MTVELSRREQNVLRRLLGRADFRAREVAALGLAKLQSAPGLGVKGLDNVLAWLAAEGHCLSPPVARPSGAQEERMHRRLESARHLLEQWGWQVSRSADAAPATRTTDTPEHE